MDYFEELMILSANLINLFFSNSRINVILSFIQGRIKVFL